MGVWGCWVVEVGRYGPEVGARSGGEPEMASVYSLSGLGVIGCPLEGTWQQMSPPRLRAGRVKLAAGPWALRS